MAGKLGDGGGSNSSMLSVDGSSDKSLDANSEMHRAHGISSPPEVIASADFILVYQAIVYQAVVDVDDPKMLLLLMLAAGLNRVFHIKISLHNNTVY